MTCNCTELEDIVGCGDSELAEFVEPKGLRFLREKPGARLYACPYCDTHWHVDHMVRAPQAIKVSEPFRWEQFDDLPFRFAFLERVHGGSTQEQCSWSGCSQRALKGMVVCVRHAYPELSDAP